MPKGIRISSHQQNLAPRKVAPNPFSHRPTYWQFCAFCWKSRYYILRIFAFCWHFLAFSWKCGYYILRIVGILLRILALLLKMWVFCWKSDIYWQIVVFCWKSEYYILWIFCFFLKILGILLKIWVFCCKSGRPVGEWVWCHLSGSQILLMVRYSDTFRLHKKSW